MTYNVFSGPLNPTQSITDRNYSSASEVLRVLGVHDLLGKHFWAISWRAQCWRHSLLMMLFCMFFGTVVRVPT